MAAPKRPLEGDSAGRPAKKAKPAHANAPASEKAASKPKVQGGVPSLKPAFLQKKTKAADSESKGDAGAQKRKSLLVADDIDFPRGGGTELTAHEVREARQEAKSEMRAETEKEKASASRKRRLSAKGAIESRAEASGTRVEHLNYKRLQVGTKLLGRIAAIYPLHLVLSLPDQLAGHVPITHITSQLTAQLEKEEATPSASGSEDEEEDPMAAPELNTIFRVGQYVTASVTVVRSAGTRTTLDLGKPRSDMEAMARRVELTLVPEVVNEGVVVKDVVPGFMISGAIKGVEDHGYSIDVGIHSLSGFLPFTNTPNPEERLSIGHLLSCSVAKLGENRRVCTLSTLPEKSHKVISEVSNVVSVLPGTLVRGLVTASAPSGLNVQILGFFDGTIELTHLPKEPAAYTVGSKLKARVLWHLPGSSPPKFALSAMPHVVRLEAPMIDGTQLQEMYTYGMIVHGVRVVRVEAEWSLLVELEDGTRGFVHIGQIADEHIPALSPTSGAWKVGTTHEARVLGFYGLDGLLQLSLKPSVLARKFLQTGDFQAGEIVKGTIQRLTDVGMFVDVGGNISGRVAPDHYADIILKHPEKRYRSGASVKCRILAVDPEHGKLSLTCKKSLLNSDLPIIAKIEDAKPDMIADAVVFKLLSSGALIMFYGRVKGFIPLREASETYVKSIEDVLRIGQTVKVKVLSVNAEAGNVLASIRQTLTGYHPATPPVDDITVGSTVQGEIIATIEDARPDIGANAMPSNSTAKDAAPPPTLQLPGGFQWSNAAAEAEDEEMGSVVSEAESRAPESQPKKRKKKGTQIEEDLTLSMQERAPESVGDFERLLLGSPNSSFLWIQFMSFYLQLSEIDKAREIARRALNVINFREEQEKLNVWIALLNLENTAGTDETLEKIFLEAARANDSKTMHLRLATIFDESRKLEKAEEMHKRAVKKFSQSSKVWTLFGQHYMSHGKLEEARDLLPRSLKSLEKRKHIKTILKFALMEYELGDPERGKTLFEAIVDSHAKRLDLWFVYADMEAKQGDLQAARKLFDRMLTIKLNTFRAKSVFKKWLELEKRLGDEEGQELVKARAVEWMQNNS
ncbi:hypothetical protein CALVIDRAFT_540664 [Calocera viscosa TUFC12733]|uniref:S1 motif domain-containing protein n=1 Tax=Calocera viscosa (strain TUFC12733) TaxID=1330018 RepID=A0A167IM61_CALVF|nr:hypothetical protein CALVIDRAFT_540664 [Calocera viscosa TUFC12733]